MGGEGGAGQAGMALPFSRWKLLRTFTVYRRHVDCTHVVFSSKGLGIILLV